MYKWEWMDKLFHDGMKYKCYKVNSVWIVIYGVLVIFVGERDGIGLKIYYLIGENESLKNMG